MLNCRSFAREPSWIELFSYQDVSISTDWDCLPLTFPFSFHLALSPTRLYFGASAPTPTESKPGTKAGEFVEGLWKHDLAELFLADQSGPAYQEFNLAPNGSWWTAVFSGYRKRETKHTNPPNCDIFAQVGASSFMTGLSIPREELGVQSSFDANTFVHVSAIISAPKRVYLSSAPIKVGAPDFHLRSVFQPLNLLADGKK